MVTGAFTVERQKHLFPGPETKPGITPGTASGKPTVNPPNTYVAAFVGPKRFSVHRDAGSTAVLAATASFVMAIGLSVLRF
jgi:hypothetical protein